MVLRESPPGKPPSIAGRCHRLARMVCPRLSAVWGRRADQGLRLRVHRSAYGCGHLASRESHCLGPGCPGKQRGSRLSLVQRRMVVGALPPRIARCSAHGRGALVHLAPAILGALQMARKWARGRRDPRFGWEQPVASSLCVDMEASGLGWRLSQCSPSLRSTAMRSTPLTPSWQIGSSV